MTDQKDISIVTYHYIRPKNDKKYNGLYYLEINKFKNQIKFFENKYNIIGFEDLIEILTLKKKNHKKPFIVLTFDDGYIDHYKYVFPILSKKKVKGLFYPSSKILDKNIFFDINKIQFTLARIDDKKQLLKEIFAYLEKKNTINFKSLSKEVSRIKNKRRFDNKEVNLIKTLLQYYLPKKIRNELCDFFFKKYVTREINDFSKDLYLRKEHMIEMKSEGMHFGSHGQNHEFLGFLKIKDQEKEISESLKFLKNTFKNEENFSICYPSGSYNKNTLNIVKKYKFKLGFTLKVGSINFKKKINNLLLPRFDTNDFPQ
jgi:peptidoglycan/xylan/chitin deacetylase (PgdA/CDA1 family)